MATIRSGFSPSGAIEIARVGVRPALARKVAPTRSDPPRADPFAPPIALYGDVTVAPGSSAEVSTGSISNNTGRAIEVREIRFTAAVDPAESSRYLNPAGVIRCTMSVNGKSFMASPVPIWSLARLDSADRQIVEETRPATVYVMRLARPMILPRGAEVRCLFEHAGTINYSIDAGVCLAGRFTDRVERLTAVPYVLFWASKFRGLAETASESSPEKVLANVLKTSLHVDRIIARHATLASGARGLLSDTALSFSDGRGAQTELANIPPIAELSSLKLATSRNQPIILTPAPIWSVFETSGAIEMPHILPPNEFYRAVIATVSADAAIQTALAAVTTFRHQVHLSMVGWREEIL